jgi:hypothetical protein
MSIDSGVEINQAANALQDWFKSQDITSFESILVIEWFFAKMIVANMRTTTVDQKIRMFNEHVREFVTIIQKESL